MSEAAALDAPHASTRELHLQFSPGVFDELNIAEIPFSPLTDDTSGISALFLSEDQRERVVPQRGGSLPNPLAERAILALMWLSHDQFGLKTRVIRFSLRDLVCNYMFPGRYGGTYTPGQKIFKAVEEQLHRVAFTRLVTDRWFDRKLGQFTAMNASIIDYLQVVDSGGRKRPRKLEIAWGTKFFESLVAGYTKPLAPSVLGSIQHPLDLRLYRLLNKKLSAANAFRVSSIQQFNRASLAMSGRVIDGGGRTASKYIASRLTEAVDRLTGIGFRIRMTVDAAHNDFSLEFSRLDGFGENEILQRDRAAELVMQFYSLAMGGKSKRRILQHDRDRAEQWLEFYGYDLARRLIPACLELRKQLGRSDILSFGGLAQYEQAALSRLEQLDVRKAEQMSLHLLNSRERLWNRYKAFLMKLAKANEDLLERTRKTVEEQGAYRILGEHARERVLDGFLLEAAFAELNGLTKEPFFAYSTLEELRTDLIGRHGMDPLAAEAQGDAEQDN